MSSFTSTLHYWSFRDASVLLKHLLICARYFSLPFWLNRSINSFVCAFVILWRHNCTDTTSTSIDLNFFVFSMRDVNTTLLIVGCAIHYSHEYIASLFTVITCQLFAVPKTAQKLKCLTALEHVCQQTSIRYLLTNFSNDCYYHVLRLLCSKEQL